MTDKQATGHAHRGLLSNEKKQTTDRHDSQDERQTITPSEKGLSPKVTGVQVHFVHGVLDRTEAGDGGRVSGCPQRRMRPGRTTAERPAVRSGPEPDGMDAHTLAVTIYHSFARRSIERD